MSAVQRSIWFTAAAAVAVVAAAIAFYPPEAGAQNGSTTETFSPARYALVGAEINVAMLQNSGTELNNQQKVLFKLDTVTGKVWVLQLAVSSYNDPTVQRAVWAPVQNDGSFGRSGN